jgi:hypothetical protein
VRVPWSYFTRVVACRSRVSRVLFARVVVRRLRVLRALPRAIRAYRTLFAYDIKSFAYNQSCQLISFNLYFINVN